jgi:hypothetical protein
VSHGAAYGGGTFQHDMQVRCRSAVAANNSMPMVPSKPRGPTVVPVFLQMQLNPALSHQPEPDYIPASIYDRDRSPSAVPSSHTSMRVPLPAYRFPPMDTSDEVF